MSIGATIIMLLFFPLNSLLFFQNSSIGTEKVEAKEIKKDSEASIQGLIAGVETKKKVEILKAQATDNPQFQPIRKEGFSDLKIPDAHASVVIDADSGTILQYSNGKEHRQIASLTKLMTAILVMEKIKNLDEVVTISEESVYADGTKIGCPRSGFCNSARLKVGEKITVRNLLQAMLTNSANDAAIALGKHIAVSQESFAAIMNQKAKELGLSDTNFCTASGLDLDDEIAAAGCYSSAYDIARIGAYSLRYDTIWNIARMPSNYTITSIDGNITHTILNTDQLLDSMPNMLGTKTGFTPLAGYSLLMAITDDSKKHRIIAVLLDDKNRWQDIKTATNWAFNAYVWR